MGETKYYGACDDLANLHAENEHCKNWVPQLDEPLEPEASSLPASPAPDRLKIAIRKHKFTREEFPIPVGLPQEIYEQLDTIIDAVLAEARAGDQGEGWIPVGDRLPTDYCQILIYGEGVDPQDDVPYYRITEVRWDMDEHFRIEDDHFKVTHWQPMPRPPAPEESAKEK